MKINYKETIIVKACPFCGHAHEVAVNESDYWAWEDGELAQNAFPYLSADEREILISGICPTCWDKYFGSDEEPDPDEVDIHGNTPGGEEPAGVLDDYAIEYMEHMYDDDADYWDDGCPIEDVMKQIYIDEAAKACGGEEPPEPEYTEEELQEAFHSFMADILTAIFGGEVE